MPPKDKPGIKVISVNRKARHNFFIEEVIEAGIELKGSEVKSIRLGAINLKEGYAHVREGEIYLEGVHINPYEYANQMNHDPLRPRRLLLHRREINHLEREVKQKRLTLVPLRIYFKRGRAKIEIGLGKGKKLYDKRESVRKAEVKRELDRIQKHSKNKHG